MPSPVGHGLSHAPGFESAEQQQELLPQAARPRTRAAAWVSYKVRLHPGRPPPCRPRSTCTRTTGSSCPRSRRTTSLRHLVAEQLVDRPSEEEVELENERMAAPGAWKADADTSGATSPPPSSWVRHAGIGNWRISDAGIRSRSAADGDPVDIISTQFTLCLQPRAPDFIYFSNPFHVGISHNTAYTTSFLNYGGQA